MEIDLIFQWKKKMSKKTDLLVEVKDILKHLYADVSNDTISYTSDDEETHLLSYNLSKKNNKAYLQIISKESEAKAANILSAVRERIIKGKHRNHFIIICTYDGASCSFCDRLMKPMGMFERHLRELMYLIIIRMYGVDWIEKTFSEDMYGRIKGKTHGMGDEKIIEQALEFFDYEEIIEYLFSERYFEYSPEQLMEEVLSDESLNNMTKEEIISYISSYRKDTLWNKLFLNIKGVDHSTIDRIRKYRNDVMHHHTIDSEYYMSIRKEVQKVDRIIVKAIREIEDRVYNDYEYKLVHTSIGHAIAGFMKALSKSIEIFNKKGFPDLTESFSHSSIGVLDSAKYYDVAKRIREALYDVATKGLGKGIERKEEN